MSSSMSPWFEAEQRNPQKSNQPVFLPRLSSHFTLCTLMSTWWHVNNTCTVHKFSIYDSQTAGAQPLMSHTALFTTLFCPENDKQPLYLCTLSFDFVVCVLVGDAVSLNAALALFRFNGFCTSICVFRSLSVVLCPSICFPFSISRSFFHSSFRSLPLTSFLPHFTFALFLSSVSPISLLFCSLSGFHLLYSALPLAAFRTSTCCIPRSLSPPIQASSFHQYKLRNLLMHSFYTAIASID